MNKIVLMGRVTKDIVQSYTNNNTTYCRFSLAVPRRFSKNDEVDFINIIAWKNSAQFASKYFQKGQRVCVVGRLQSKSWDDADGNKRYGTEVVADELYFADSKKNVDDEGVADNPFGN